MKELLTYVAQNLVEHSEACLLYTSDAADD